MLPRLVRLLGLFLACSLGLFGRVERRLDDGWRFTASDESSFSAPATDDSAWTPVSLPHDWTITQHTDPNAPGSNGTGFYPGGVVWYRLNLDAPAEWTGQRVALVFDGIAVSSEVWLNGVSLGRHPYPYTPVRCDLTALLKPGQRNVIAVRADNTAQPNSRWYTGTGIYRPVHLVVTDPLHIPVGGVFVTTESLSTESAQLRLQNALHNDRPTPAAVTTTATLFAPDGREVAAVRTGPSTIEAGATSTSNLRLVIPNPQPWSPDTPTLYRLVTRITEGDRVLDETTTPVGLRTVRVSAAQGFELNGRRLVLIGGNVHHDNGPLGAAAFDRAEERRVQLLKAAGYNAVRTAHNPPSPAFLDACDRLGLLVLDEAFDGWAKAKNKHDYSTAFADWSARDVDAMVLRDRHHPSVVLWSIGNEVFERGNAEGLRIARELTARIKALDTSRAVTAGINGLGKKEDWPKLDPLFAAMDVAGYNYETVRHADDHARLPERVILLTETYLKDVFEGWETATHFPYVIGEFVWSGLDYLGESFIGGYTRPGYVRDKIWIGNHYPYHAAYCGDIDLTGWRKPVSHYRNIVWDRGETLYAAVELPTDDGRPWNVDGWGIVPALPSWTWPGLEGRSLVLNVYSRHAAVRVYLNNQLLGEKPTTAAERFAARFEVPYAPGALRVVGVDGGWETKTTTLTTAGREVRLRLTADRATLRAGGQDLAFVTVETVDENGVWRPDLDQSVRYTVTGAATIAGIGSGDTSTTEPYVANPRRLFQGRSLVVLRTDARSGPVTLTAQAPGMAPASVTLQVEP